MIGVRLSMSGASSFVRRIIVRSLFGLLGTQARREGNLLPFGRVLVLSEGTGKLRPVLSNIDLKRVTAVSQVSGVLGLRQ